ncbi:hypothetical protein SDC9_154618 [bioreactor metagenome]|uniref:Uncharacterized protein n=1 Tax=bioreactor metagenome TaxID=1076179 RepID=A0A645F1G6_9ZZZZ
MLIRMEASLVVVVMYLWVKKDLKVYFLNY